MDSNSSLDLGMLGSELKFIPKPMNELYRKRRAKTVERLTEWDPSPLLLVANDVNFRPKTWYCNHLGFVKGL
jgi:hypothetical protein